MGSMRVVARASLAIVLFSSCSATSEPPQSLEDSPTAPAAQPRSGTFAATDPHDLALTFRQQASGLTSPVALAAPQDGTGRLFIVEQRGTIKVRQANGTVRSSPFLDIQGRVNDGGNEQGLLGLAFHPDYKKNRKFFVAYTEAGGDLRVEQYRTNRSYDRNRASSGSRRHIITVAHPPPTNHNGGQLAFYRNRLFISTGDGGSGGDPSGRD